MSDRFFLRTSAVGIAAVGVLTLAACGSSTDESQPPSATTQSSAAVSSSTTSSSAPPDASSSTPPRPTAKSSAAPQAAYPPRGTTEEIAPPKGDKRSKFLAELNRGGVNVSDATAVSLGTSLCGIKATNGDKTAQEYAKPVLEADSGKTPSPAQVKKFVDAVDILC
ncbi:DUF732 domain-containing protein [Gordonia sp. MP11Mi]|uniref:DUF732 domain-containing protein n=1 Tax=Gordonia sp. MP11Mi TaxID=3022769 RepID=A0AA97CV18_9ACTN